MSDGPENPFGVSLLKEKLRAPPDIRSGESRDRFQLRSRIDARGTTNGRPTNTERGLAQAVGEQPQSASKLKPGPQGSDLSDPSAFLRELESLHVQGMFMMKRPANVSAENLTENDKAFKGAGAPMGRLIGRTARQFGVPRGLLAEHLVAEHDFGAVSQLPANASLADYLRVTSAYTASIGLDDFVNVAKEIGPAAEAIAKRAVAAPLFVGESKREAYADALARGASPAELAKFEKPQLKLTLADAIPATAMYLSYKTARAKKHIPDFDTLPPEIQWQLVRLFVNPPSGDVTKRGINYIIREARAGRYMNLFDFSDRSASETQDTSKASDIYRRATIHTARAIHLDRDILGDQ